MERQREVHRFREAMRSVDVDRKRKRERKKERKGER